MVKRRGPDTPIPSWVWKWLVFNAAILLLDGGFCVLRPHSLGDGWIGTFFYGYRYYVDTDIHYADTEDSYVWAQGWLSVFEGFLNLVAYFNYLASLQKTKVLIMVTSIMTSWKSLLFILYSTDYPKGGHEVPSWTKEFLIVYMAPVFWVIFPAYVAYLLALDFKPSRKRWSVSTRRDREEEEYEYELILPEGESSSEDESEDSYEEESFQEKGSERMRGAYRKAARMNSTRGESSQSSNTNQGTFGTDKGGDESSLDIDGDTLGNDVGPDWSTDGSENGSADEDKRGIRRYDLRKRRTVA